MTIPQRMAFFWAGDMLSWLRYLTLLSFRHHNPEWEIWLYRCDLPLPDQKNWTSHEGQDHHLYAGPSYLERVKDLGIHQEVWQFDRPVERLSAGPRSDLFAMEYLVKHGGYYADMDILFVSGMTGFQERIGEASTFQLTKPDDPTDLHYYPVGFLGSAPGSPLYCDLLSLAYSDLRDESYQWLGQELWRRHRDMFVRKINRYRDRKRYRYPVMAYPQLKIHVEPGLVIYPFQWFDVAKIFIERHGLPIQTVGIHWYGGHPVSQNFNCELTEENCLQADTTFASWARPVIEANR